jgi:hypothetical protein
MKISKGAFEDGKAERGDGRNRRMVLQSESERLREDCVLRGRNELVFVTIDSSLLIENEAREYAAAYGVYTSGSELRNQGRKREEVKVQQRASEKKRGPASRIHQGDEKPY